VGEIHYYIGRWIMCTCQCTLMNYPGQLNVSGPVSTNEMKWCCNDFSVFSAEKFRQGGCQGIYLAMARFQV